LNSGGDNLLAVRVLNPTDEPIDGIRLVETPHRNKAIQNYQPGRSYNIGGIVAPVELLVVPALRISTRLCHTRPRQLEAHGVTCRPFESAGSERNDVILVGDISAHAPHLDHWVELARRIARGSTAIFLRWRSSAATIRLAGFRWRRKGAATRFTTGFTTRSA
jgi:hypothetical protein